MEGKVKERIGQGAGRQENEKIKGRLEGKKGKSEWNIRKKGGRKR